MKRSSDSEFSGTYWLGGKLQVSIKTIYPNHPLVGSQVIQDNNLTVVDLVKPFKNIEVVTIVLMQQIMLLKTRFHCFRYDFMY